MTAPDIKDDLKAFIAHCAGSVVDRRPTVWARHYDIWNEARGEIGIAAHGHMRAAMYGALAPLALVPDLGSAVLVVDETDLHQRFLSVVSLTLDADGPDIVHWKTPYEMSDTGKLTIGLWHPEALEVGGVLASTLTEVLRARKAKVGWDQEWSFDDTVPVIAHYLERFIKD